MTPLTPELARATLDAIPYARFLGLEVDVVDGELILRAPFKRALIGNPMIPALHGGVVGALLEITAIGTVAAALGRPDPLPRPLDIDIDYLRPGKPETLFAAADLTRMGRRFAHASARAWQGDRADPVALLRGHFVVQPTSR